MNMTHITLKEGKEIIASITEYDIDHMTEIMKSFGLEYFETIIKDDTDPATEFARKCIVEFMEGNDYCSLTEYERKFGACLYTLITSRIDEILGNVDENM